MMRVCKKCKSEIIDIDTTTQIDNSTITMPYICADCGHNGKFLYKVKEILQT